LTLDAGWQEAKLSEPIAIPDITKFKPPTPLQGDPGSLRTIAAMLASAESPLIIADRVGRNPEAVKALIELAETGSIAVIDGGGALNFPNSHPLDATGTDALSQSDVVILMDVQHVESTLTTYDRYTRKITSRIKPGAKVFNLGLSDLWIKSTMVDFGRLYPVEMSVAADSGLAIPQITQELRSILAREMEKKERVQKRFEKAKETKAEARKRWQAEVEKEVVKKPISLALLAHESWKLIKGEKWIVAGNSGGWTRRLWEMDRPGSVLGGQGAAALGSGMPKAIGAGLAAKRIGGFCVDFQSDGDLLYVPSSLWTAVHHRIPMLTILLDNGGYIGEGEHVAWTSRSRGRSTANKHIATEIKQPSVDFASLARAHGAYAEGPIEDPSQVGPALKRAFDVMKEKSTLALVWVKTG
jgi:acetolactate synthase-1/2/3 large subunit